MLVFLYNSILTYRPDQEVYHSKVQSVTLPIITLQQRIIHPDKSRIVESNPHYMAVSVPDPEQQTARGNARAALSKKGTSGIMTVYNHDFDSLADYEMQEIMVMLMDTLPSVNEYVKSLFPIVFSTIFLYTFE